MRKILKSSLMMLTVACGTSATQAAIVGPYTPDATTLQLYHFDGSASNAVVGGVNLNAFNGATTTDTGYVTYNTNFGQAAGGLTTANQGYFAVGAAANGGGGVGGPGTSDTVNIALQDATTRAFTFEAVVKLNQLTGTAAMHLISGEGEGSTVTGDRAFQFRILPVGVVAGTSDSTRVRIEFNNFNGNDLITNLPNAGADAVNTTDFFHVAMSYSGTANVADNLKLYWTKVDIANTTAHTLASLQETGPITNNNNGATGGLTDTDFGIGNELRSTGGQGDPFLGLIDEVRISSVARGPNDFIFTVPEPTSLAALASAGLLFRRRRSA